MRFRFAGQSPRNKSIDGVPFFVGEFWTARQRQAHALHEVSYRACFKPQLPEFFIERLTAPGDVVYDPFMGRGTTPLQAALMGRCAVGNDINPLSVYLTRPRLAPARLGPIADRLAAIDWRHDVDPEDPLLVFYHPETLSQILALRRYLLEREAAGRIDAADDWVRMVALNRLTGHSPGFFSVYSLPPNQAVSLAAQGKINEKRVQVPPLRDVAAIILKKTRALLKDGALPAALPHLLLSRPASGTPEIADRSVDLVVTSPPFLDIVQYASDNWLRCWFAGIDASSVAMDSLRKIDDWTRFIRRTFVELTRVTRNGGHIAFEVGEVRSGAVRLEEQVLSAIGGLPLKPVCVLVNSQAFTKTANCWGVANNAKGTNTNRIVVARRA
ncbi:MAG: DNA methyltransferase [Parvularculaceae bacterium]